MNALENLKSEVAQYTPDMTTILGPTYDYSAELPTPKKVGVNWGDGSFSGIEGAGAGSEYYVDTIAFGQTTGLAANPARNLSMYPLGLRFFIKSGATCSNGQDMYQYVNTIPTGIPGRLGIELAKPPPDGLGAQFRGLAPGIIQDALKGLDPMPMFNAVMNSGYARCRKITLPVGDGEGNIQSQKTGVWWIDPSKEILTYPNGKPHASHWIFDSWVTADEYAADPKVEGFAVISGNIDSDKQLQYITNVAQKRYAKYTTAHHEWINKVETSQYRSALDAVRSDPAIFDKIRERFPGASVKPVTEADEIYWAVSPKGAVGSDRSLVDCHYDSPFAWFPTGGVIYYRIIIACNENNTVTTTFPDENIRVKMNTKDFHGLDYNKDKHCVEGSIPKDKVRVLLKMHYLVIPPNSSPLAETCVRYLNVWWTVFSRETMRMSANPTTWYEYLVAMIVNVCRVVFNNVYTLLGIVVALVIIGFLSRTKSVEKLIRRAVRSVG